MLDFINENLNFKNKKTTDCVIRALSKATNKDYKIVAQELFELWMKTGYMINEKKCFDKYLELNGFIKHKQPKHLDGTKYKIKDINELTTNSIVIVITKQHMTCVIDNNLYDIWDCRNKYINNYYVK